MHSLVILSFNKLSVTQKCVSAVVSSTHFSGPAELILVDNGSTDGSVEWMQNDLSSLCADKGLSLKLILNNHNVGCSTARNQALAAAEGEYVTFLDNDVEPASPDWLDNLRARMESNPKIGMVGGLLVYPPCDADKQCGVRSAECGVISDIINQTPNAKPQACTPDTLTLCNSETLNFKLQTSNIINSSPLTLSPSHLTIQCAGVGISQRGHVCFCGRGKALEGSIYTEPREVQCLISACMMIRRSLYVEYGGFDEVFNPVQFEDFDLCYLYRNHGWQAWYEPKAMMYHHESTTTAGSPSIRNAAVVVRNGLKFQKKWRHVFSSESGPSEAECKWKKLV